MQSLIVISGNQGRLLGTYRPSGLANSLGLTAVWSTG